jgi:hypothetical protein
MQKELLRVPFPAALEFGGEFGELVKSALLRIHRRED